MAQKTRPTDVSNITEAVLVNGSATAIDSSVKVPQMEKTGPAEHEKWLYENPEALASVNRGLADLAAGRVHVRRSYAEYAESNTED